MSDERQGKREGFSEGVRQGLGVLSAFKEAIEETLSEVRERGDLNPERARAAMKDALHRAQAVAGEAREKVDTILEGYDGIISDLRKYIQDLKRVELAGLSLHQLIEEVASLYSTSILEVNILPDAKGGDLSLEVKVHLYHILRELLTNAVKHSGASHIKLTVACRRHYLTMTLLDDGKGFELSELKKKQDLREKLGLLHIRGRVEDIKGSFQIMSSIGQGTKAVINIHIEEGCTDD